MSDDFWGVHVREFLIGAQAGFTFSLANAFRRIRPAEMVARMVVGGFMANYFAVPAQELISKFLVVSVETSAFFVGLGAFAICRGAVMFVLSRIGLSEKGGVDVL